MRTFIQYLFEAKDIDPYVNVRPSYAIESPWYTNSRQVSLDDKGREIPSEKYEGIPGTGQYSDIQSRDVKNSTNSIFNELKDHLHNSRMQSWEMGDRQGPMPTQEGSQDAAYSLISNFKALPIIRKILREKHKKSGGSSIQVETRLTRLDTQLEDMAFAHPQFNLWAQANSDMIAANLAKGGHITDHIDQFMATQKQKI
jgi:hypothetical protein